MRADLASLNAEQLAELASATASPRQRTKAFQVIETAHDGLGFAHRGRLRVIKAGKSVIVRPRWPSWKVAAIRRQ
jgi:hypothetical protein